MRLYAILLLIFLLSCDSFTLDDLPVSNENLSPTISHLSDYEKTSLWNEIKVFSDIYYESWDTYQEDNGLYHLPSDNADGVGSFKPKGTGVIPNCDLVWTESESGQRDIPTGYQWWAPENSGITRSLYFDRGNWDRYVQIPNGFPQRWQSYPGWTNLSNTHDFIYIFRLMPGNVFETLFNGVKIFNQGKVAYTIAKSLYPDVVRSSGSTPVYGDLFAGEYVHSTTNEAPNPGVDAILRIQRNFSSGQIRVWINEKKVIDFVATPSIAFKNEFTIGTNSHPLAHHMRALLIKNNGHFTDNEYEKILINTNLIWPRKSKPVFPYLDDVHSFKSHLHFKTETNSWDITTLIKNAAFSGGTGKPGNHTIQWYYWNPSLDSNIFRRHLPLEGATNFILDRDDYTANGQPFHNHEGDSYNIIFYVITPYDDEGNAGEPLRSAFVKDTFP